jgi:hypothetical protein
MVPYKCLFEKTSFVQFAANIKTFMKLNVGYDKTLIRNGYSYRSWPAYQ